MVSTVDVSDLLLFRGLAVRVVLFALLPMFGHSGDSEGGGHPQIAV